MTAGLLIVALLTALLTSSPAAAQPAGKKLPRVAFVYGGTPVAEMLGPNPVSPDFRMFLHTLRDRGWLDGQTVVIDRRSAERKWDQVPALFADVIRHEPDVIVAVTNRMAEAAKQATSTIPIVATMGRAVETGLAASLARPGGNLTGIDVAQTADFSARRLQLLKEAVPGLRRVAVLGDASPRGLARLQAVQDLVKPLGITLTIFGVETEAKLDAALAAVAADRPTALVTEPAAFPEIHYRQLADFALRHRLPTMTPYRELTEAGMLMSYGYNVDDLFRHLAVYVDRILRGAKPGDLPIEQPTKWDFAVNRKTARALGLTLPPSILAQATEVID